MGRKLTAPLKYAHLAVVEGRGEFPFDMLRYDAAFPATSADASAMQMPDNDNGKRRVTVKRHSDTQDAGWNRDRWQSYGWPVVAEGEEER